MSGDTKYVNLFVEESREILEKMGGDLLALERDPRERRLVDSLFRGSHSIKGMASSLGLTGVSSLAHSMERHFARIRSGEENVGPELAQKLLLGIDGLREAVEGIAADGEVRADLRKLVAALESPDLGEAEEPAATLADEQGPLPVEVRFRVAPGEPFPAARALVAWRRAAALGRVVDSNVPESALEGGVAPAEVTLTLAPSCPIPELRRILGALDGIAGIEVAIVPRPEPEDEPARSREAPSRSPGTIRVRTEDVDAFLDGLSEMILRHSRLEKLTERSGDHRLRGELDRMLVQIQRLHQKVLEIRMIPFGTILGSLDRAARDLATACGKRVRLDVTGAEVTLDRAILESVADPVLQVLRNAIDHGIEPPGERAGAGKPETGTVRITVERLSDSVRVVIADDGRGINAREILRKAVEKGFFTRENARAIPDEDALMVITQPGFSTAEAATEISGHGVGMNLVRDRVETLGGNLRIFSRPGAGTRIEFLLPLTVAVVSALLVESEGEVYAVPVRKVIRTLEFRPERVHRSQGREVLLEPEGAVELVPLEGALEVGESEVGGRTGVALLFGKGERTYGLVVDAVLERRDIVVKALGEPLVRLREYSGATILGDGRIVLILDLENLV